MQSNPQSILAGYEPALLEDWYRHNYFNNSIDISGSGAEEYTYQQVKEIAGFSFSELDNMQIRDCETAGSIEIRRLVADMFGTGDPDMAMVTNGSNEALQLVVRSILESGDEIVTQGPCYHCHDKIAVSMGCTVKKWELSSKNNFELEFHKLKRLITPKVKALFLNFPHNPTGVSITQKMLDDIVSLAKENDIYLVWDAAFQELVYKGSPLEDPIHAYKKAITIGSFSKAYGAPGLRFGWIVSPVDVIAACVRQKDYGNLFVSPVTEFIAIKMLENLNSFAAPRLKQAAINREIVNIWAENSPNDISWRQPDGGVCGLLKLPKNIDDVDFCKKLLDIHGVLLVPGTCFEMPGFVRLGFGGNTKKLKSGLSKLDEFLFSYSDTLTDLEKSNIFTLKDFEVEKIQALVELVTEKTDDFNDLDFLKELPNFSYKLPPRLVKFLNEFKYNAPKKGYCIISNFKVDDSILADTPSHWKNEGNHDSCKDLVTAMCLCSTVLGDIFGWLTQQDGNMVHDIMPIKAHQYEQLGSGCSEELTWHNEDAFHEFRGDYLMLMCLRNPDNIPTTVGRPDFSRLSDKHLDILFQKRFTIRPDNSHKKDYSANETNNRVKEADLYDVNSAYQEMSVRDEEPEFIQALFGSRADPYLRLDPYFMAEPEGDDAKEALKAIIDLTNESLTDLVLKKGDCLIVDNYMVVHGRRAFEARYDGTDRWLKRINIIRDIRRCHDVLASKVSRVIY